MTDRVIIEATAERGIRAAVRWKTQNASPTIAARWCNGLIRKIDTLRTHPFRCPVAAESDEFPVEIRELLHGRLRDVYRPRTERQSHYFHCRLAEQFDVVVHLDRTSALAPLDRADDYAPEEVPETYPSGT